MTVVRTWQLVVTANLMERPPQILLQGSGARAHVRGGRREEGGGGEEGGGEEMTSCLYECLCEVGLQRHYHR